MADSTALASNDWYRPLNLVSYDPALSHPRGLAAAGAEERRRARQARRKEKAARHDAMVKELTSSFVGAVTAMVMSVALGVFVFGRLSTAYSVVPETGTGAEPGTVVETDSEGTEYLVPTTQTGVEGWQEPNIADDCPIVWQRAADGSFQNNNGAVLGSGCHFGVDVSEHDGQIDWETAKANGVEFAIIRCGYGTDRYEYDDVYWEYNVSECERLGIPYGAYLYSYVTDPEAATYEASHVIRLIDGHDVPLGVWYDIEEASQAEALGYDAGLFDELVDNFAESVESATGKRVGVYTSRSWLDEHMSKVASDADRPIWCACWTDWAPEGCDYQYWQAGAAAIPGFNSQVDFDVILG